VRDYPFGPGTGITVLVGRELVLWLDPVSPLRQSQPFDVAAAFFSWFAAAFYWPSGSTPRSVGRNRLRSLSTIAK